MASVNKVILVGNLGGDPEVRYLPSGDSVANFNIATTEKWKGKDGNPGERTEWHRIVVFGKLAELCKEYLKKGRSVYVEGRLQTKEWDDKEGQKRKTTEIIAQTIQFLGSPGGSRDSSRESGSFREPSHSTPLPEEPSILGTDDDIPF